MKSIIQHRLKRLEARKTRSQQKCALVIYDSQQPNALSSLKIDAAFMIALPDNRLRLSTESRSTEPYFVIYPLD